MEIIIFILLIIIFCLIYFIFHSKNKLINILLVLKAIKKGDKCKSFAKGNGIISEINFELNNILSNYQNEIEKLKIAEQSNKQLLTSLSHDVRTPLTSLLGYLDAIESGIVNNDEKEHYIKISRNKAYDLKRFVDTLFDWFKLNSHEHTYKFEAVDINEYSKEIIISWLPIIDQKKINLEVNISEDEFKVSLDKNAYSRIINNLFQNAISHGRGNLLKFEIKKFENNIEITVSDNGIGIEKEKLPYIFDRLYKCDDSRSNRGSGLGLAIVKELVNYHNGIITVESVPNVNTTFTISLPC